MRTEPVKGYMCQIAWDHETFDPSDGNRVYASIDDLKKDHTCWEKCGIVQVEVREIAVIHQPTERG